MSSLLPEQESQSQPVSRTGVANLQSCNIDIVASTPEIIRPLIYHHSTGVPWGVDVRTDGWDIRTDGMDGRTDGTDGMDGRDGLTDILCYDDEFMMMNL